MLNVDSLTHLFIVPAMKNFDALTALEKWTEENMAPDCLVEKAGKKYLDQNKEQPFCPYLKVATYIGGEQE
ncbi:tannase/feruloyl esterase family alpha/beta hydrolase [Leptotrichia sp. HSP-342]|uniref:Tannase/feruloyl esterase family alpha/beta hydrolase n=1 Tax=Leptotrichia mesophila TaxID=3239303 RepID=A0AB39VEI7_9FUSO